MNGKFENNWASIHDAVQDTSFCCTFRIVRFSEGSRVIGNPASTKPEEGFAMRSRTANPELRERASRRFAEHLSLLFF